VEKGIEKFSRFIMPGLILLILGIAVFSLTLSHEDANGTVRTGLQGLKVYLLPDVSGLTVKRFLEILLDAMSQIFPTPTALPAAARTNPSDPVKLLFFSFIINPFVCHRLPLSCIYSGSLPPSAFAAAFSPAALSDDFCFHHTFSLSQSPLR
jgi:hypothetical protein